MRPPAIAAVLSSPSTPRRCLRPPPTPRLGTRVIPSCAPEWVRVLRPISCNGRLLHGCPAVSPPKMGLWPLWLASGSAGSVSCWGCLCASMLALSTNNRKCPCHRPYDAHGDHVSTCCQHLAPRARAYNHALTCLGSLSNLIGKKLVEIQLSDLPGSRGVSTRRQ